MRLATHRRAVPRGRVTVTQQPRTSRQVGTEDRAGSQGQPCRYRPQGKGGEARSRAMRADEQIANDPRRQPPVRLPLRARPPTLRTPARAGADAFRRLRPREVLPNNMKALTYHGSTDVRVETVADPVLVDDDDILLRVTASAICGSDLHIYRGRIPGMEKGDILGHDFWGSSRIRKRSPGPARRPGRRAVPISCWRFFAIASCSRLRDHRPRPRHVRTEGSASCLACSATATCTAATPSARPVGGCPRPRRPADPRLDSFRCAGAVPLRNPPPAPCGANAENRPG